MTGGLACTSDWNCSLNGQCLNGGCVCDVPWAGEQCGVLRVAPGLGSGVDGVPLGAYHGADNLSTSWGGSVLHAPEDGLYYMWVAAMANHCDLTSWEKNSEVHLAASPSPLGPFYKLKTIVPPWAHNPQTSAPTRAPGPNSTRTDALVACAQSACMIPPRRLASFTPCTRSETAKPITGHQEIARPPRSAAVCPM